MQSGKWTERESMDEAVNVSPGTLSEDENVASGAVKVLERWWRIGVRRSFSSRRGSARAVSWVGWLATLRKGSIEGIIEEVEEGIQEKRVSESNQVPTNLQGLVQPPSEFRNNQACLFSCRHIRLSPSD